MAQKQKPARRIGKPRVAIVANGALEDHVVDLAINGQFANAARRAVRKQVARGIAVTFRRGNKIIKRYADGSEAVLAGIVRPPYKLPVGVGILDKK